MHSRSFRSIVLASLSLATIACDDPALVIDEALLLVDDPDAVDAAIDGAIDQLDADNEPALVINTSTVWGVEYGNSETRLFRHNLDGTDPGPAAKVLKYNGANVQIDGLALNSVNQLYGFMLTSGSQLVNISADGVVTKVGTPIALSRVRGATFSADGKLLAVDVVNKKLHEVSTTTGQPTKSTALTLNGAAFMPSDNCDIAVSPRNVLSLVSGNTVYDLATTGALTVKAALAASYSLTGATFNASTAGSPDQLVALNATADSIIRADLTTKAVVVVRNDVIPGHDAGRGDLASKPFHCTAEVVIPNGSFEAPVVTEGKSLQLSAGSTQLTGWTIGLAGVDVMGKSTWAPAAGNQVIDLNNLNSGSIALTTMLTTTSGITYRVAFAMAANPTGGDTIKKMDVFATGGVTRSYSFDRTGKTAISMGWRDDDYFFKAGAAATVKFTSTSLGNSGPALDNVRVYKCSL